MNTVCKFVRAFYFGLFLSVVFRLPCFAKPPAGHGELADEPLVDIAKVDPTIFIDLRYASSRNIAGHPIYSANMPCLIRSQVAQHLKEAQYYLHQQGFSLKIWDAYRPVYAQQILWDLVKNPEVVADPAKRGGSMHTWGAAVDATLVDLTGHNVPMPTDFDDFTPAAAMKYTGGDPMIAKNLKLLQGAMSIAGFHGMRDEWWHFTVKNWQSYAAILPANPGAMVTRPPSPPLAPASSTPSPAAPTQ